MQDTEFPKLLTACHEVTKSFSGSVQLSDGM